jgi:hypothetical protein
VAARGRVCGRGSGPPNGAAPAWTFSPACPTARGSKTPSTRCKLDGKVFFFNYLLALKAGLQTFLGFSYVHTITIAIHGRRLASEIAYKKNIEYIVWLDRTETIACTGGGLGFLDED